MTKVQSLENLINQKESEYLEFKQEFHENPVKLIHDIICLANAYTENDRYLIFGIKDNTKEVIGVNNDSKRKTNADIQDTLRASSFNRIPDVRLETVKYNSEFEVDVLMIKNRPDKPFFLLKDKKYGKDTIRAGVIYTRLGDTNTPLSESASEDKIELMWRERFGFGLPPLERMNRLLDDIKDWVTIDQDTLIYHKLFPEFSIRRGVVLSNFFQERWVYEFSDPSASLYVIDLKYFETTIHKERFVECDSWRSQIPLPQWDSDPSSELRSNGKLYIEEDSFAYKIAKILRQYHPIDVALKIANIELR